MELDPYEILNVPYDATITQIREQFKKLVLKHHPDRGGDPNIFNIVKQAYSYLYKYKLNEQKQLEKEQRNFDKYTSQRNFQTDGLEREFQKLKINPKDKNIDMNKFNKIFEEHRIEDADERGYGFSRGGTREEADELLKKYANKKAKKMEIEVYEEPEPTELTTDNYKKLGQKHVKDFSSSRSQYTDLQKAYTEYDSTTMKNYRTKEYKSVGEYETTRKNQNFQMSEEDKRKMRMKEQQELAMEEKRRYYVSQQDKQYEKQFNTLSRYITYK